jgi:hypothetical protein
MTMDATSEATDGAAVRFALDLELREAWLFWGALPMCIYIFIYLYYSSSGGSPRIFLAFSLDKTVFPFQDFDLRCRRLLFA